MLIDDEGIDLEEEDGTDMNDLIDEVDEAIKPRSHFQSIFWKQQVEYNKLKISVV